MISNLKLLNMGLEINSVCSNFLVWFSYHVGKIVSGRNEMTKYSHDPLITLQQHTRKDGRAQGTYIFVTSWFNRTLPLPSPRDFMLPLGQRSSAWTLLSAMTVSKTLRPISSVTLSNLVFLLRVDLQYRTRIQLER